MGAINGGKGWKDVTFRNHKIDLNGPTAQAMGDYVFTDATSGDKVPSSTPSATSATTTVRCGSTCTTRRCPTRPRLFTYGLPAQPGQVLEGVRTVFQPSRARSWKACMAARCC